MSDFVVERRRTGWDIVLGILLVIAGSFILGNAVLATALSVLVLGWIALLSGIVALVAALLRIGKGGFWPALISGGVLTVLGLMFLRNPGTAVVALTLAAGALFLASGVIRLVAAFQSDAYRVALLLGGVVSLVLGLIVLFNLVEATFTLLGLLVGVDILVDGISLILVGRVRVTEAPADSRPPR